MRRYEKYKDSGIEWIGEIPEHWRLSKCKFLFREYSGNGFPEEMQGAKTGNIPFYKVSDLNGMGIFVEESNNYVSTEDIELKGWNLIPKGTILTAKIGEALRKNHRKICTTNCLVDNNCLGLEPKSINFKYAFYLLKNVDFDWFVNPGAVPSVSMDKLRSFFLPITTSIEEQATIANYLDQKTEEIDELIKQKEELLLLFEEEKIAIINFAVTKGIDHNVKLKDSKIEWLGEIPEHWELTKLKYVTNKIGDGIHTTPTYTDFFEIYFINGTNLENGKIRITEGTRSVDEEEYEKHKLELKNGTILISLNGTIGKMAFYNGEKVILGKSAAYIECKEEISNEFVYYFLQSNYLKNCFEESFSGTTINNLSLHTLRNTKLIVPERDEQNRIVEFIKQNIHIKNIQIENTIKLIGLLKDYKISMISEVATGKVKVI